MTPSLLQSDAFAFPANVLSPEGLGGAAVPRSVSFSGDTSGARSLRERHKWAGPGVKLKLRCLTVDSPAGVRLALQADMPLGGSDGSPGSAPPAGEGPSGAASEAAGGARVPTTLEATLGSVGLAVWPGNTNGGGEPLVVDAFAGKIGVVVARDVAAVAAATPAVAQGAAPAAPAAALLAPQGEQQQQQVLRVDRAKVLFAGTVPATATAEPPQPSALRRGDAGEGYAADSAAAAAAGADAGAGAPARRSLVRVDISG
jgi:hypothetical protein